MDDRSALKNKMRIIEGFPAAGISYKDITTILQDATSLRQMVDVLCKELKDLDFDYILGVESRGFICGVPVAYAMQKGFLMARKPGKLPGRVISKSYQLEYGEATIELDVDSVPAGARVVVMDDLLATGGTATAVCELVEQAGGVVARVQFLTELKDLGGRAALEAKGYDVHTVLEWDH